MTKVIVEIAAPEKIILFGSQARGTAGVRSDYDILIVEAKPFGEKRSRRQASAQIRSELSDFRVPIDQ